MFKTFKTQLTILVKNLSINNEKLFRVNSIVIIVSV